MEMKFRVRAIYGSGSCIGNVLMVMLNVFIILDHVLCPVDAVAHKTTTTIITEQTHTIRLSL